MNNNKKSEILFQFYLNALKERKKNPNYASTRLTLPVKNHIADKVRFPCEVNYMLDSARTVTYFFEDLANTLYKQGTSAFAQKVVQFIASKQIELGIYVEYVNAVTHIMDESIQFADKLGVDVKTMFMFIESLWEELHWFYRNYADRRGWHIRLSKLEKKYL